MGQATTQVLESYKAAFARFRADPPEALRVKVRRSRAAELRSLLSHPETVTVEWFNREVWPIERGTFVHGKSKRWIIFTEEELTAEEIQFLNLALEAGQLEFHGNYCWGVGTRIYAPTLKDPVQKEEALQRALSILNNPAHTPLEKANLIGVVKNHVPGFGAFIASGLVMVFYPNEFAHYNTETIPPVEKLGHPVKSLEAFQRAVQQIKQELGADDFIELDRFLHVQNRFQKY